MKNRWLALFVVLTLVLLPVSATTAKTKPIRLVFQSNYPATHPRLGGHTPFGMWLDAIERESKGRIVLERHWGGEPVPKKETLDGISRGVIDMLITAVPYYSGKIALGDFTIMPKNFRENSDIFDLWYHTPLGDIVDKTYQKRANAKWVIPMLFAGYNVQISKKSKKVKKLEDIKGLKMRAPGGMASMTAKLIGASPVMTIGGEYYTALQRGTIDAGLMPTYTLEGYKAWEVCDQIVGPQIFNNCIAACMMNLDKWNELGPDLQKMIIDQARYLESRWISFIKLDDIRIMKLAKAKGVQFYTLPLEDQNKMWKAVDPVWDLFVEKNKKQGLGGEAQKVREIVQKRFDYVY